jgi:general stress protein 26
VTGQQLVEYSGWDNRARDAMSLPEMLDVIDNADTCVFVRLRGDGHPVGAVVGHAVLDGQIYTLTNLFRAAYRSVQRDDRVCAVFDRPQIASVTVIGRSEIIDDPAMVDRFFTSRAPRSWLVQTGKMTVDEFLGVANTSNRRLIRIHPEKFFSSDQRTLMSDASKSS